MGLLHEYVYIPLHSWRAQRAPDAQSLSTLSFLSHGAPGAQASWRLSLLSTLLGVFVFTRLGVFAPAKPRDCNKRLVGVKRSPDTVVPLQCNYGLRSLHACFSEYGLSTEGKPDMLESG